MKRQTTLRVPTGSAREAIHDAAVKLFAKQGYAATTTRQICEQARITKPVLYYHFGNKEQLFYALMLDAHNEFRKEIMRVSRRGKTARERLVEVLAADFAQTRRDPGHARLHFRVVFAAEKDSPRFDSVAVAREWLDTLAGIAREGIRSGEMHGRPQEIAEALMGIHLLYTMSYLVVGEPKLNRALATRIVDLLSRGCGSWATDR
jgi:AcrR family transcriptional regulator